MMGRPRAEAVGHHHKVAQTVVVAGGCRDSAMRRSLWLKMDRPLIVLGFTITWPVTARGSR